MYIQDKLQTTTSFGPALCNQFQLFSSCFGI